MAGIDWPISSGKWKMPLVSQLMHNEMQCKVLTFEVEPQFDWTTPRSNQCFVPEEELDQPGIYIKNDIVRIKNARNWKVLKDFTTHLGASLHDKSNSILRC